VIGTRPCAEEAEKLAKEFEGSGGGGLSSWNKAGTWEERGHTEWAKMRITEMVVGKTVKITGTAGAQAGAYTRPLFSST